MEIKVVGKDVSGMGLCPEIATVRTLKTAFEYKSFRDAVADIFGFETHIILQTARRTIEVKKEHPQWCVCIEDPEGMLEFRPFYTDFEHGLSKCSSVYKMGLNAVLYVKTVAEGWKSYWTFNH